MNQYQVQHEYDDEPTYIVTPPDSDNEVATLSEQLPWELRQPLARLIARILDSRNPVGAAIHLDAVSALMER